MKPSTYLTTLIITLITLFTFTATQQAPLSLTPKRRPSQLLITAIKSHTSPPHHSYMQCLIITSSTLLPYPTIGNSLFLSNTTNTTLVVLPPDSEEGWHNPPGPMWFVLLSGKAVVECPWSGDEVVIEPRQPTQDPVFDGFSTYSQMILALDVQGKGHLTSYPSEEDTVALQIRLPNDLGGLSWQVFWDGPC